MTRVPAARRSDLDALRGFAMLLGVALHAAMTSLPADLVSAFAPLTDMTPVGIDEILAGRQRLRAATRDGHVDDGRLWP